MKLDIRASFLVSALQQAAPVQKGIRKLVETAAMLSFQELLNHQGIHLEKVKGILTSDGRPLYTLRATRAARAIATVEGETLILLVVEPDHDKVY
ncbi:MAG: hypothetical protein P4L36_10050 [Holophaga sp.]|nr:hypothetical protein [Holophaga sp.]